MLFNSFHSQCLDGTVVPSLVFGSGTCDNTLATGASSVTLTMRGVSDGLVLPDRVVSVEVIQVDELSDQTTRQRNLDTFDVSLPRCAKTLCVDPTICQCTQCTEVRSGIHILHIKR